MGRLVVVSNRVPSSNRLDVGGLAVGLRAALSEAGGLWFGGSGNVDENPATYAAVCNLDAFTLATVDLSPDDVESYYNGFANRVLWPLLHGRSDMATFDHESYVAYREVNEMFAAHLAPMLRGDDTIWVHDYHLIPLAAELRRTGIRNPIGFFLHVPFPPPETMTALPWHTELCETLCAYDLIGFQTDHDLRNFHEFAHRELGASISGDGVVAAFGHRFRTGAFPIGIDVDHFADMAGSMEGYRRLRRVAECLGGQTTILGVDRLDYTKGLPERMLAYERLLQRERACRRSTCLVQIAAPSREDVPEYMDIRSELERISGRINGRFAELDWTPVRYLNRALSQPQLAALYRYCRVGLVTPLRDGMNLVAKEYVAAQDPDDPGVLILSQFAGAAEQMHGALIVNPLDQSDMVATLRRGLRLSLAERRARWLQMIVDLRRHDVFWWYKSFLSALEQTQAPAAMFKVAS